MEVIFAQAEVKLLLWKLECYIHGRKNTSIALNFSGYFDGRVFTSMQVKFPSLEVRETFHHQLKLAQPRSVEAANAFHKSPPTSITSTSFHRPHYFHGIKCTRNLSLPWQ